MKRKIMLGASAGLIGALAIAGAAFAQDGADGNPRDSIKDRVAEILGINREDLDSATKTARGEYRDARQEEKLDGLVEQEVITQAQADEITAWQDARPDAVDELRGKGRGHGGGKMPPVDENGFDARLTALVEQEVITQGEADEILAWYSTKPEYLDDLRQELRGERNGPRGQRSHGRHHGFGGRGGFGQHRGVSPESGSGTTFTLPNGSEINF
ncbi:MAG: hypothetical protein O6922_01365 [Chloroflexi bacterium]|nr:hypothetical protein [Chloroflexota bacterium]